MRLHHCFRHTEYWGNVYLSSILLYLVVHVFNFHWFICISGASSQFRLILDTQFCTQAELRGMYSTHTHTHIITYTSCNLHQMPCQPYFCQWTYPHNNQHRIINLWKRKWLRPTGPTIRAKKTQLVAKCDNWCEMWLGVFLGICCLMRSRGRIKLIYLTLRPLLLPGFAKGGTTSTWQEVLLHVIVNVRVFVYLVRRVSQSLCPQGWMEYAHDRFSHCLPQVGQLKQKKTADGWKIQRWQLETTTMKLMMSIPGMV